MGDRLSRDAVTGRRGRPGDAAPGPSGPWDDTALHTTLAAALLAGGPGPDAERMAVAAFRTARDAGAHGARTRHRDDWRLPAVRRTGRPVKTAAAALLTSIALGGVAVGAIGSAGSSSNGAGEGSAHPSTLAPTRQAAETAQAPSGGPGRGEGSSAARDTAAHCRAYERDEDRGKALDSTAWRRLVAAAGGEAEVDAYCAERLARATPTPGRSGDPGGPGEGAADDGAPGRNGTPGNGQPGGGREGGGGDE
ncbi:hypothetical protein [Streptomyces collinus]|uniref:hypothetical protein n=1 Tax=Streptomyces collinus TaxID=42684 RepID=UPI0037D597E8